MELAEVVAGRLLLVEVAAGKLLMECGWKMWWLEIMMVAGESVLVLSCNMLELEHVGHWQEAVGSSHCDRDGIYFDPYLYHHDPNHHSSHL